MRWRPILSCRRLVELRNNHVGGVRSLSGHDCARGEFRGRGLFRHRRGLRGCAGSTWFSALDSLSWLWIKLIPYSNLAWRVAVGSAWAAALACGLTALMVSRGGALLLGSNPAFSGLRPVEQNWLRAACGIVAGLALGFCETIWSQVAKCDIWAVSVLLFAIMQLLLMRWTFSRDRRRFLYGGVVLYGLVLTNSQFWIVFAPGLAVWVLLNNAELGRDFFLLAAILLIAGLLPIWDQNQYRKSVDAN